MAAEADATVLLVERAYNDDEDALSTRRAPSPTGMLYCRANLSPFMTALPYCRVPVVQEQRLGSRDATHGDLL